MKNNAQSNSTANAGKIDELISRFQSESNRDLITNFLRPGCEMWGPDELAYRYHLASTLAKLLNPAALRVPSGAECIGGWKGDNPMAAFIVSTAMEALGAYSGLIAGRVALGTYHPAMSAGLWREYVKDFKCMSGAEREADFLAALARLRKGDVSEELVARALRHCVAVMRAAHLDNGGTIDEPEEDDVTAADPHLAGAAITRHTETQTPSHATEEAVSPVISGNNQASKPAKGAVIKSDPMQSKPIEFCDLRLALEQAAYRLECLGLLLGDLNEQVFQFDEGLSDRIAGVNHALEDLQQTMMNPLAWLSVDVRERLLAADNRS